jgi:hypothetical protein
MLTSGSSESARTMTAGNSLRTPNGRVTTLLFAILACSASAQTPPSPLDLRLQPLPTQQPETGPAVATPDEYGTDNAATVHGAFTTGVGYSKDYGNSTFSAAELDVNKQYDNGRALNLHIDVQHSKGPGVVPRDYVSRYPGG